MPSSTHLLLLSALLLLQTAVSEDTPFADVDPKDNAISSYARRLHRKRDCLDQPLDVRVRQTEFIFTGTVRVLESDPKSSGAQIATVEVKRFFKGPQV
jgi:hypothetical protein